MFSMTISFGNSGTSLLFKTKEAFEAAREKYRASKATTFEGDELHIVDDYGAELLVKRSALHGALFEDMDQTKLGHVERGLHQARLQIAADKAGMAAPDIATHMRARMGGPSVLAPNFGANGAFRQ